MILHTHHAGIQVTMRVVADRFVETDGGEFVDLATGQAVVLTFTPAGGTTEQRRWAARCDWFHRLRHPRLARLLDFGVVGESRRFEAWGCTGPPRERESDEGSAVVEAAVGFLRACGLTCSGCSVGVVAGDRAQDRLIAIPDADAGFDSEAPQPPEALCQPDNAGLAYIERRAVAAIAERFEVPLSRQHESPAVCLFGPEGVGRTTAVLYLARVARLHGFVPMSVRLVRTPFGGILDGRSAFVIDDGEATWRRGLLDAALRSPRQHVVVSTAVEDERGTSGASLSRLSVASLLAAVRPERLALDGRVRRAAEQADGLPGRFLRLLLGIRYEPCRAGRPDTLIAAERAPSYGVDQPGSADGLPAGAGDARAVPALRAQVAASRALLAAGRHAPGDRRLRHAIGALARRGDWTGAGEGALALAASLLSRGRPRDARAVLDAAREYCERVTPDDALVAFATLAGVASIDLARLADAERVLCAAAVSRPQSDETAARVALALARCRFWQARYGDADAVLDGPSAVSLNPATRVRFCALRARVAVGRLDFSAAMAAAADAGRLAETCSDQGVRAEAACAAAFAHLAVGDLASVQREVEACVAAARSARDPLRAVRARLLLAEQLRRAGRRTDALVVLHGLRRFAAAQLPPILRRRHDLARELTTSTESAARIAARHAAASGLPALALFGQSPGTETLAVGIEDAVAMLRVCQGADAEDDSLAIVCQHAQRRLDAAAVAFFDAGPGSHACIAGSGPRLDAGVAARAMAAGLPVGPHRMDDRVECAVPVYYGGAVVGALAARWATSRLPDASHAVPVLTMAATAAAPLVCSAVSSRARAFPPPSHGLIGISQAMSDLRRAAERAADAPFAVLVEGESGSGKELVARAIHKGGPRRDRPFRTLNCAALPDDLVESELFGHARGAFTGALAERVGVFEEAHSGTLLLDEIGELSLRAQAKLLRVLQEGELRRIGENVSRRIDVRVVSATNRDLREEAAAGRFRVDLLYRLDVLRITVPALRDRRDDIPLLVEHVWREATSRVASRATLGPGTVNALARYHWPGNVRELQNVLAALAVRVGRRGVVPATALPPQFVAQQAEPGPRLEAARRAFDERFVRAALIRTGGSRARTAAELGISRQGLAKLMARLGIAAGGERRAI